METVKITVVTITPNPVNAGAKFVISVSVAEDIPAILTSDGYYIETSDGYAIERTGG